MSKYDCPYLDWDDMMHMTQCLKKRVKRDFLEEEFEVKNNDQIYWDDVAMFCHPEDFDLTVYPIKKGDILEIDSFEELCELDISYRNYKK